jgi:NTP pyrophosphatase (non-canonical NTP hydrolase)
MKFDEYQKRALETDQNPREEFGTTLDTNLPLRCEVIPLLGMVGEVGGLLAEYKKLLRDGSSHEFFRDEVAEELGDVLWYVANVASKFDLSLEVIAEANLKKAEDRWLRRRGEARLYDDGLSPQQQLPRQFEYAFEHRKFETTEKLVLVDRLRDNVEIGDPLTDNAYEDNGYRFHDVMHLTFGAMLGWSPVWRKLLRRAKLIKNREEPAGVAEAQDGGRAQVIDEGIVVAAYVYASRHAFLESTPEVDWKLIRHIKEMTADLEVSDRTAREWNDALLRGFAVWRRLRECNGGIVRGDLCKGTIEFTPPI